MTKPHVATFASLGPAAPPAIAFGDGRWRAGRCAPPDVLTRRLAAGARRGPHSRHPRFFRVREGFTLPELIVVIGVLMTLLGFTAIGVLGSRQRASLSGVTATFVSDLRSQQLKAMVGDTEGRGATSEYGVRIEEDRYILFVGPTFDPVDPNNIPIQLPPDVRLSSTLPGGSVMFSMVSGDVVGAVAGADTVTIATLEASLSTAVRINRYGVALVQ